MLIKALQTNDISPKMLMGEIDRVEIMDNSALYFISVIVDGDITLSLTPYGRDVSITIDDRDTLEKLLLVLTQAFEDANQRCNR
jgi:hypothetical protein